MVDKSTGKNMDPKELIELAKAGNNEAYGKLYELFYTPIYRYLYFRLKDKEEASDLSQTVFLKVYKVLDTVEVSKNEPLAYFYTVARNTLIDYRRKKKDLYILDNEEMPDIPSSEIGIEESIDSQIEFAGVEKAMQNLTEEQREVITMRFIHDMSYKEISETLGKREDAIRQLQSRALKILKENLNKKDI
ncbi:MAG: RNA polymerase sigma factor [Candidatus Pacebacteria bacterium]|nr:RNA polymerase sigma factor [Candidatus Paceibacterota bacterium]MBP9772269.1 RNA polymerase sigma factor [Candidatus Paceibacterota bacterium]QQR76883.1 MAG: RNA polymerase sigma factor [Candidatus Nomurabacteria bacterium]